jgi:hypothetical protein
LQGDRRVDVEAIAENNAFALGNNVVFISNPERALRWGSLRQDSGDPFKFVREAKEAYRKVEDAAGVKREDDIVAKGKRIIFSDGLDVDSAVALQKGCDSLASLTNLNGSPESCRRLPQRRARSGFEMKSTKKAWAVNVSVSIVKGGALGPGG